MSIPRQSPTYLLAVALVFTGISVTALRANNKHMIQLRDAVYAADKNNTDIQKPLKALQHYVVSHMNTNLSAGPTPVYPPIQLKYTYDRLVHAQGDAVAAANTQLYSQAQAACEAQNSTDFSGRNRVPCIEAYVEAHNPAKLTQVPDALYKFAFTTPRWSPDLAGWSIVIATASYIAAVLSFAVLRFKKT
jgi:hypothetical protein